MQTKFLNVLLSISYRLPRNFSKLHWLGDFFKIDLELGENKAQFEGKLRFDFFFRLTFKGISSIRLEQISYFCGGFWMVSNFLVVKKMS